jgi:DNA-binding protein H-NS
VLKKELLGHLRSKRTIFDPNRRTPMKRIDFQSMSVDKLWALHEKIGSMLVTKVEADKRELEKRLGGKDRPARRPYPKVFPKFQNPEQPGQTWAGRGKQPRWVGELLAAGRTLEDLRIPTA